MDFSFRHFAKATFLEDCEAHHVMNENSLNSELDSSSFHNLMFERMRKKLYLAIQWWYGKDHSDP
jgi:hypothetical protein